jgi:hypothetical protein
LPSSPRNPGYKSPQTSSLAPFSFPRLRRSQLEEISHRSRNICSRVCVDSGEPGQSRRLLLIFPYSPSSSAPP